MSKVIIAADYSSLEPRIFAHWSGSQTLRNVYADGLDLYSVVAINVLGVKGVSAREGDSNYLGKVNKPVRQETKIFTLLVPYNGNAYQVCVSMNYFLPNGKPDFRKGQALIDKYLDAFPELRDYMGRCKYNAMYKGYVANEYGRIRNLSKAKDLVSQYGEVLLDKRYAESMGLLTERGILKSSLNAACNFPIQSTAADVVNRAMIEISREFKRKRVPATIRLQIHDELVAIAEEAAQDEAKYIIKNGMENNEFAKRLTVPLVATPIIARNLSDAK